MDDITKIKVEILRAFCYAYIMIVMLAILGAFFKVVDVQFVQGLVTGLIGNVVMFWKDFHGIEEQPKKQEKKDEKINVSNDVGSVGPKQ